MRSYFAQATLFINKDHLGHLMDVLHGKVDNADVAMLSQALRGSLFGATIFADQAVKMNYQLFVKGLLK